MKQLSERIFKIKDLGRILAGAAACNFLVVLFFILVATPARADIVTGLVGWWKLDGNATDYSGKGNNGTIVGPTATTDRFGRASGALSFDGTFQYVALPETGALPTVANGSFTLAAWAKINGKSTFHNIFRRDNITNQGSELQRYILMWTDPNGFATFTANDEVNNFYIVGAVDRTDNQWHHFVSVCDAVGRNVYLYVDGGLEASSLNIAVMPLITAREPWVIGAISPIYTSQLFLGSIDDARIYNRALTPTDITELYNMGAPKTLLKRATLHNALIR